MKRIFKINPIHKKAFSILETKQKLRLLFVTGSNLLFVFLDLFGMVAIFYFMLSLLDVEKKQNIYVQEVLNIFGKVGNYGDTLLVLCVTIVLVYALKSILYIYLKKIQTIQNQAIGLQLKSQVFKKFLYAPYAVHLKNNTSEILNTIKEKTSIFSSNYLGQIAEVGINILVIILFSFLLAYVDPVLFLSLICIFGMFIFIYFKIISRKVGEKGNINITARIAEDKILMESMHSIREIKLLSLQKRMLQNSDKHMKDIVNTGVFMQIIEMIPRQVMEFLFLSFTFSLMVFMVYIGKSHDQIISELTILGVSAIRLLPIIAGLNNSFANIKYASTAVNDLYEILNIKNDSESINKGTLNATFSDQILLKDLNFSYQSKSRVLKNIHIAIPKGKNIGFVGESGSGKSTVLDVLLGLLVPEQGAVLLDGKPIAAYKNYGNLFGYIPQQIYLSDNTIASNIAYFLNNNEIDFGRLQEILKQVELYDFVQTLPDKEFTVIGERGVRLSGGQRQRIGIARALYRNPEILIMDEATAALDNVTEAKIIATMKKFQNKTTIMVAHRLTTIQHCDIIYLMDKGCLAGVGTYDELSKNNEIFKKMLHTNE